MPPPARHPWTLAENVWYKPWCIAKATSLHRLRLLSAIRCLLYMTCVKFHINLQHFGGATNTFDACHQQLGILGPLQKMSNAKHDVSQRSHHYFFWYLPQLNHMHYIWCVWSFILSYNSMAEQSMLSLQSGHPWTLVWYKPSCFLEVTSVFHLSLLTAIEYTITKSFVKFHIDLKHFGWAINAFDACHHQLGILGPLQKMSSAHHDVSQRSHECFIWDCPQLYNIH